MQNTYIKIKEHLSDQQMTVSTLNRLLAYNLYQQILENF